MARKLGETGHERVNYEFSNELLSYDAGIHYQPCIKASCYFNKMPHVSYEHFEKHWATVHADVTVASKPFARHNVLRYVQHHTSPEQREQIKKIGQHALEFDGCSTLWFRTWEDYAAFFTSPDFGDLSKDGEHFLDLSSMTVYAGHDVIAVGKAIPGVDDRDGVTSVVTKQS